MCTAIAVKHRCFYFGRTLDNHCSYGEKIVITPRKFPLGFNSAKKLSEHFAFIGMASVCADYPLYYDGVNEKGLCVAGLNFVGNAVYSCEEEGKNNVPYYEFINFVLAHCESALEAVEYIKRINVTNTPFQEDFPVAELHWLVCDKENAFVVECQKDGVHICENPTGVLSNNPPFNYQLFRLVDFAKLSTKNPTNSFSDELSAEGYSLGLGALGLPGDWSSSSRFVRANFVKSNFCGCDEETENVNRFFQICDSVAVPFCCVKTSEGEVHFTLYSSCVNADRGIYYCKSCHSHRISAVNMKKENLDTEKLFEFSLPKSEQIEYIN